MLTIFPTKSDIVELAVFLNVLTGLHFSSDAFSQGGHSVDSLVSRFNNYNSNGEPEPVQGK